MEVIKDIDSRYTYLHHIPCGTAFWWDGSCYIKTSYFQSEHYTIDKALCVNLVNGNCLEIDLNAEVERISAKVVIDD